MKIHLVCASLSLALISAAPFALRAEDAVTDKPPAPEVVKTDTRIDNDLLATIRKSIADDKTLSTLGQNIKVERDEDTLTLTGLVSTDAEKAGLGEKVAGYVGKVHVVNNLAVQK